MATVRPLCERIEDFATSLAEPRDDAAEYLALRRAETIGRPLGNEDWIKALERDHGRALSPRKRGRKTVEKLSTADEDLFSKLSPQLTVTIIDLNYAMSPNLQ